MAAVRLDDAAAEIQAEAKPLNSALHRALRPTIPLEEPWQFLFRHTDAVVPNEKLDQLLPALSLFGYPGLNDHKLLTETTLDVAKLLGLALGADLRVIEDGDVERLRNDGETQLLRRVCRAALRRLTSAAAEGERHCQRDDARPEGRAHWYPQDKPPDHARFFNSS